MKRGIGWCENPECSEFQKPAFLLGHSSSGDFWCPGCRRVGGREDEVLVGVSEGSDDFYSCVRVEFDFDPATRSYRQQVVAWLTGEEPTDASVGRVAALCSPLVRTEQQATKLAEALLANLNVHGHARSTEHCLYLDSSVDEFRRQCAALGDVIAKSAARRHGVL